MPLIHIHKKCSEPPVSVYQAPSRGGVLLVFLNRNKKKIKAPVSFFFIIEVRVGLGWV